MKFILWEGGGGDKGGRIQDNKGFGCATFAECLHGFPCYFGM